MYKGSGGIIYNMNTHKLVIVKGNQGIYSFPKGHFNSNESLEECASREIEEETGLHFDTEFLHDCHSIVIYNYVYFIITLNTEHALHVNDTHEIATCSWYGIDEILCFLYNCNQCVKKVISNWSNFIKMMLER